SPKPQATDPDHQTPTAERPFDHSTVLHAPPTPAQCARPFHRRSSNALVTTLTLENAIAAPAI
ncbi:hypothetical protein, partial [Burkholderia cepacia]|uniref:hypothetical protein n=1 Tax=Burkholderia cepacia TaxID=292 RepID=UPI003FF08C1C